MKRLFCYRYVPSDLHGDADHDDHVPSDIRVVNMTAILNIINKSLQKVSLSNLPNNTPVIAMVTLVITTCRQRCHSAQCCGSWQETDWLVLSLVLVKMSKQWQNKMLVLSAHPSVVDNICQSLCNMVIIILCMQSTHKLNSVPACHIRLLC